MNSTYVGRIRGGDAVDKATIAPTIIRYAILFPAQGGDFHF